MKLSERGYALIKSYEGYHQELKDGSGRCTAYQEEINGKRDVPTIGYGCTKGVKMGDIWTREQAEEALRAEIAKHEARVTRLVTVELNQNEYDACTSFDFNCGGLTNEKGKPSGFLRALNRGDKAEAMRELETWNKFNGKPSKGLIARRAAEKARFLEPVGEVTASYMPQKVEEARTPLTEKQAATVTTVCAGAVLTAKEVAQATGNLPSLKPPTAVLEQATAWKSFAASASEMLGWAVSSPKAVGIIAVTGAALWFGPKVAPGWFGRET